MIPQKYHKPLEISCYIVAIVLFIPFIISIVMGAFAIDTKESSTVGRYLYLVGSLFVGNWILHIPAIALIIIVFLKKRKIY